MSSVTRAAKTLRHCDWFEVTEVRGQIKDGKVEHFQVGLKVGFRVSFAHGRWARMLAEEVRALGQARAQRAAALRGIPYWIRGG